MSLAQRKELLLSLFEPLEQALITLGYSYSKPKPLAKHIKNLSDWFIQENYNKTPWSDKGSTAAYLAYYTPLNFWRWLHLTSLIPEDYSLEGIENIVDYGCGSGSASLAIQRLSNNVKFWGIDESKTATELYTQLLKNFSAHQVKTLNQSNVEFDHKSDNSTLICSYVLNENAENSVDFSKFSTVLIMEPSTHKSARYLMSIKSRFTTDGYSIIAPCTHQNSCPLLDQPKQWCHMRTEAMPYSPLKGFDQYLPFRNETLTYSFLMASRLQPATESQLHRVIGDEQVEKGKTKFMSCSLGGIQQFSHLKRDKIDLKVKRGDLLEIDPRGIEQKKTESRIKSKNSVLNRS